MEEKDKAVYYDIDRIKKIPISNVISNFEAIKHKGQNIWSLCPWHPDNNPSLSINEKANNNYCHCFACNHGGSSIDYVMQHESVTFNEACKLISQQFGIPTINNNNKKKRIIWKTRPKCPLQKAKVEYTYIPADVLDGFESWENSFCQCLRHYYSAETVEQIVYEYRLATFDDDRYDDYTIFPTIDTLGRICDLKVQRYGTNPAEPSFFHFDHQHIYTLGKVMVQKGALPKDAVFNKEMLFGAHLLPKYPNAVVALVESPKNAIVGACEYPTFVWVATGNKTLLKRETLAPLWNRKVWVIPDRDAFDEWKTKLNEMEDLATFLIDDICVRKAPEEDLKYDIADLILDSK